MITDGYGYASSAIQPHLNARACPRHGRRSKRVPRIERLRDGGLAAHRPVVLCSGARGGVVGFALDERGGRRRRKPGPGRKAPATSHRQHAFGNACQAVPVSAEKIRIRPRRADKITLGKSSHEEGGRLLTSVGPTAVPRAGPANQSVYVGQNQPAVAKAKPLDADGIVLLREVQKEDPTNFFFESCRSDAETRRTPRRAR